MSGFQSPITIHQAMERINRSEFLLPSFQREFVWSNEQIEKLFDSLMKGYPISSMLFWKVRGDTKTDFRFYDFLKSYVQTYKTHNEPKDTSSLNDFHAILDGQQRLTALYIGLLGSYAYKEYRKSNAYSESSYPTRHLYLNLTSKFTEDESDMEYKFSFLNKAISKEQLLFKDEGDHRWFKVGHILKLNKEENGLDDFIDKHGLSREEKVIIRRLNHVVHNQSIINYYEEDDQVPDKAVNIFVRINSGGTYLSFSDILMSIAIASWKVKDARTEILGLVDQIRAKGYNIDKDYVLKSFLYLYHKDVRFRVTSFKNDFIAHIETNWEQIRNSILSLFDLIKTFGLTDYTLTTNNATLPILYYLYHKNIYEDYSTKKMYEDDRNAIRKWLYSILIRRTFGGQTDTVLAQSRKAFTLDIEKSFTSDLPNFPSIEINTEIKKLTDVGDDFIEEILLTQKDSQYSFPVLALLYPDLDYKNNNFHQDHLHPADSFENLPEPVKQKLGWKVYNSILNLQMLDANENMSKQAMSLVSWVTQQTKDADRKRFLENHIIPIDNDLALEHFEDYVSKRKTLLTSKLKALLN